MSQGSGLIGKIFGSAKKEEKILNASYRAGQKKGRAESGKAATIEDSTSISSDEEVYHDNAAGGQTVGSGSHKGRSEAEVIGASGAAGTVAGAAASHHGKDQTSYGAAHGHQSTSSTGSGKVASSKGQVVSQPPKVNRQPLDQTYGGDYTDGKTPTEVSTHNAKTGSDKGPVDNTHPRYGNDATPVKGQGQFFDPRDTQGGLYKSGAGEEHHSSTHGSDVPVGVTAAAASAGIAGGVAKGEYGDDSEATHAQLQQKNLKTKPTAYANQEAAEKHQNDIETEAYNAGRRKGLAEADSSSGQYGNSREENHSKSVDPKAEHGKNKSAYNAAGLAGATAEAKHGSSGSHGKDAYGNDVYSGQGTGSAHESGKSKTLDPAGTHTTGAVASTKPGGYEKEIKRLDQSIADTQREIDALGKNSTPTSTSAYQSKSLDPAAGQTSNNQGILGTAAAALGLGGAATAADKSHEHRDTFPEQARETTIGQASVPSGQPVHVNTVGSGTGSSAHATSKASVPYSAIETEAYNAGHAKGSSASRSGETAPGAVASKETTGSTGSTNPGLFGGVAGAASAAGALAASAVGFGGSNTTEDPTVHDKSVASGSSTHPTSGAHSEKIIKPELESTSYEAGYAKGETHKGAHDSAPAQTEQEGGYLDSAKAAIASAGVAAASAFGYEGYNKYYNDDEHTKQVERDQSSPSYERDALDKKDQGQVKPSTGSAAEQHPGATATSGDAALSKTKDSAASHSKNIDSDKSKNLDSQKSKDATSKSESGQGVGSTIAGAVAGAASAVGLKGSSAPQSHKVDSLVEEAAEEYKDVSEQPRHKTKGGVLEDSGDKQKKSNLPDDLDPSKTESSEAETSGVDNTKLESDIAAYNKKHGFTQGKSLIEVAEESYPEIKQESAHHDDGETDAPRHRTPSNNEAGAVSGVAATAAGKKLADEEKSKKVNDGKKVSDGKESAGHVNAAAGKSKDESKEIEAAAQHAGEKHRASSRPVNDAATGKTHGESREIESAGQLQEPHLKSSHSKPSHSKSSHDDHSDIHAAAYNAGLKHGSSAGHVDSTSTSGNGRHAAEGAALGAAAGGAYSYGNGSSGINDVSGVTGKTRRESTEIQQAAQLGGAGRDGSRSEPVPHAATGKSAAESREIEQAAYAAGNKSHSESRGVEQAAYDAGHKHGSAASSGAASSGAASSGAATGLSKSHHEKSTGNGARPVIEVIGIADRDEAQRVAQQTTRELIAQGEDLTGNKIVIDANKKEVYKQAQTGARSGTSETHSGSAGTSSAGASSGQTQPDASFHDSTKEVDGSGNHRAHEKVKSTLEHEAEKGNLGNVPAEDTHYGSSSLPKSASGGAFGAVAGLGAGAALASNHQSQPDASFLDSPKEVDGSKYHHKHEQVKDKLENEAEAGHLGNIPGEPASPNFISSDDRSHSYSHRHESPGKEVSHTEVTVQGEPDTRRAQVLAKDAVGCLKGRRDIVNVKELKVDAHTGAITDQDGHFIGQLSQRRLSQVEPGLRRVSSGGLVTLQGGPVSPSRAKSTQKGLDDLIAAAQHKTPQGPFSDKYDLASAQSTAKTEGGYKMPGSFL